MKRSMSKSGASPIGMKRSLVEFARAARRSAGYIALLVASVMAAPAALAADDTAMMAQGKKLFTETATPPCAVCHTLSDAGSKGTIGPVLDELKPDANRVQNVLHTGLGAMPSYKDALSEEQIEALAYYVSHASGGAN